MSSVTEASAPAGDPAAEIIVPSTLAGVNVFSTHGWWDGQATSGRRSIDHPGAAEVLGGDELGAADQPTVLMITRPLVDWLPAALETRPKVAPVELINSWADDVLAWCTLGQVRMIISRSDPRTTGDLVDVLVGADPIAAPEPERSGSEPAAVFAATLDQRLSSRGGGISALGRRRARAAVDAVMLGTDVRQPGSRSLGDAELHDASLAMRRRLVLGGIDIRGSRAGLLWPQAAPHDLNLDVAAESALAVLLCNAAAAGRAGAGSEAGRTGDGVAEEPLAELRHRLATARRDLDSRRSDPHNIRRAPATKLLKRLLSGRAS